MNRLVLLTSQMPIPVIYFPQLHADNSFVQKLYDLIFFHICQGSALYLRFKLTNSINEDKIFFPQSLITL